MTQALAPLDSLPALASLLERELRSQNLAAALELETALPEHLWEAALAGPLRAIASRPGKEHRSRLVVLAWALAGGDGKAPAELAGIVEALHLGSLIVDDIEDGSPSRRGGQALHAMIGLPLALNAGNWLYFLPGVLLSRLALPPELELELRTAIERAIRNCHYGQALDLAVRVTELPQREVTGVVRVTTRLKTGSLTELAMRIGAATAGGNETCVSALGRFGREFGVALQMLDDLTGLTSERRAHKGHEDLIQSRPTWPWSWLAEQVDDVAYVRLRTLAAEVVRRDLHPERLAGHLRRALAGRGREAIHEHLSRSLHLLRSELGEPAGFDELCLEVERLERYDG